MKKSSLRPYKKITNPTRAAKHSTCPPYKKDFQSKKEYLAGPYKKITPPCWPPLPCQCPALLADQGRKYQATSSLTDGYGNHCSAAKNDPTMPPCFARCTVNIGQVQGN